MSVTRIPQDHQCSSRMESGNSRQQYVNELYHAIWQKFIKFYYI